MGFADFGRGAVLNIDSGKTSLENRDFSKDLKKVREP